MDPQSPPPGSNAYAFDAQMLIIAAITTVFLIIALLVSLHLYARWWLRRDAAAQWTHLVLLADNHNLGSPADRGLEPAVLSSLPVFTYSSEAKAAALLECAVCLSEFEEDETVRLLPKCNHAFHIECIDMWFHSHSTCPLCRSPVEPAVDRAEPAPVVALEVAEDVGGSESGSSSGCSLCATCQLEERSANVSGGGNTASFGWRGKVMDVKIDVGPRRRAELENELSESSPVTRLLSFKRLLSMGLKSPVAAETSRVATELDLEGGLGEPIRVHTPN